MVGKNLQDLYQSLQEIGFPFNWSKSTGKEEKRKPDKHLIFVTTRWANIMSRGE